MFQLTLPLISFLLVIALGISAPALSKKTSSKSTPVIQPKFQSQFSRNLEKNFQAAKSEGCFVLYDLKRDREHLS
jgi:beta-lactamase class D